MLGISIHDEPGLVSSYYPSLIVRQPKLTLPVNGRCLSHILPSPQCIVGAKLPSLPLSISLIRIEEHKQCCKNQGQSLTGLKDERRVLIAPLCSKAQLFEFLWLLFISMKVESLQCGLDGIPSQIKTHPMQIIQYLCSIDASPTIEAVMVLTMEMTLRIAAECDQ